MKTQRAAQIHRYCENSIAIESVLFTEEKAENVTFVTHYGQLADKIFSNNETRLLCCIMMQSCKLHFFQMYFANNSENFTDCLGISETIRQKNILTEKKFRERNEMPSLDFIHHVVNRDMYSIG